MKEINSLIEKLEHDLKILREAKQLLDGQDTVKVKEKNRELTDKEKRFKKFVSDDLFDKVMSHRLKDRIIELSLRNDDFEKYTYSSFNTLFVWYKSEEGTDYWVDINAEFVK